ncbi:MAG: hypothetical protein ACLTWD_09505 [Bacteroides uniformis]|jgi:hypothetical protein
MDSEIRKYCKHILKVHIEVLRHDRQKGVWYWDYPAAASICYSSQKGKQIKHRGYSHSPKGTKWHHILRKKMEKIGEIGKPPYKRETKNIIGNCAEQHAGNNLMRKYKINELNTLSFSYAVRPRTMEIIPACHNCKSIFPIFNL